MSEDELIKLRSDLQGIAHLGESFGKVFAVTRALMAGIVVCLSAVVSVTLWVEAKASSLEQLKADVIKVQAERKETMAEWQKWRSDIDKTMATIAANQQMVIRIQQQQQEIINRLVKD